MMTARHRKPMAIDSRAVMIFARRPEMTKNAIKKITKNHCLAVSWMQRKELARKVADDITRVTPCPRNEKVRWELQE